jgi:hypothetical protein
VSQPLLLLSGSPQFVGRRCRQETWTDLDKEDREERGILWRIAGESGLPDKSTAGKALDGVQ